MTNRGTVNLLSDMRKSIAAQTREPGPKKMLYNIIISTFFYFVKDILNLMMWYEVIFFSNGSIIVKTNIME